VKPFRTGVVIGKFYPPHNGHHFLIKTASEQCEQLFVLVCWKPSQTVPIDIRMASIREVHPEVTAIAVEDILADDDTPGWAKYTIELLGQLPDAVFTSEDYGDGYAQAMGSRHVMVDRHRKKVPCSGTMIRENPLNNLEWVSPCVRAFYVKRICIVGAESTGKTTLAQKLAEHYQTNWVAEYGRDYCIKKWKNGSINDEWLSEEFVHIAQEQSRLEDDLARSANRVRICDTDPFATTIWHERYLKTPDETVRAIANARKYALYILTGDEIPFVQDGLRDGEHIRHWMHNRFIQALNESKKPWVLVSGTLSDRVSQAIGHIDKILSNRNS
jgi:NadR type nicotinamide-nucleotide adenylyltransferase